MADVEGSYPRFAGGLIDALYEAHRDLAWFQFNAGIVDGEHWVPHVSEAEDLEADLIEVGAVKREGRYPRRVVEASITLVVQVRVGRIISAVGVHGHG